MLGKRKVMRIPELESENTAGELKKSAFCRIGVLRRRGRKGERKKEEFRRNSLSASVAHKRR